MKARLALVAVLSLASCGEADEGARQAAAAGEERISCAVEGADAFEPVCGIERTEGAGGPILTIRHPSGGFRRLLITRDGRGVVAADGAERAAVAPVADDRIEVTLGGDRYRLPATVRGTARQGR